MMKTKKFTVSLLFNMDGTKVLLQKKDRTAFAGKLNGVGGKVEVGESITKSAFRKIREETSVAAEDMERFEWLGTLTVAETCTNEDDFPELWFFGAVVKDENTPHKPDTETEEIGWYDLRVNNTPVTDLELAGDGELLYFINMGKKKLFD